MKKIKQNAKKILPKTLFNKLAKQYLSIQKKKVNIQFRGILDNLKATSTEKRIILIGTAIYGNIGDHAISIAERTFFDIEFPNDNLVEIPISLYESNEKFINKYINNNDLIIINGGGYLGTLWPVGQKVANSIIMNNPDNRIIIFPQTVFYKENSEQLIAEHKKIVQKHSNLSLIVRDKKSYDFVKKENFNFKNILLTPDIVSYIKKNEFKNSKNKIVFVLRRDHEKLNYNNMITKLENYFLDLGYSKKDFVYTDSVVDGFYNLYNREDIVNTYLQSIGEADFVISDRLHGMILAAICGIPVIALDNVSKKVYGAYEWLSIFPYVLYFKDPELFSKIKSLKSNGNNFEYDPSKFLKYHAKIKELVSNEFNKL